MDRRVIERRRRIELTGILLGLLKRYRNQIAIMIRHNGRFTTAENIKQLAFVGIPTRDLDAITTDTALRDRIVSDYVVDSFIKCLENQGIKVPENGPGLECLNRIGEENARTEIAGLLETVAPMFGPLNIGKQLGKSPVKKLINVLVPPAPRSRSYGVQSKK